MGSSKFLFLIWITAGGFLLHCYEAIYLSMLLKPVMEKPIETAKELRENGIIPVIVPKGDIYKEALELSPDPLYQELGERAIVSWNQDLLIQMIERGVKEFYTHVFITQFPFGKKSTFEGYHVLKEPFKGITPWYIWYVNKKWLLKEKLANHILRCQQVEFLFNLLKIQ